MPERFTLKKVDECLKTYSCLRSISSLVSVTWKMRHTHTVQTNAEWIEQISHVTALGDNEISIDWSSLFSDLLLKVLYRFPTLQFTRSARFNLLQFQINCKHGHISVARAQLTLSNASNISKKGNKINSSRNKVKNLGKTQTMISKLPNWTFFYRVFQWRENKTFFYLKRPHDHYCFATSLS